jgi:hypothetical protein
MKRVESIELKIKEYSDILKKIIKCKNKCNEYNMTISKCN